VPPSNATLSEYLAAHRELLGDHVIDRFDASNGNIPFLFKVLSIDKALSIQTHPDKKTAEKLHAEHPDIYKGVFNLIVIWSSNILTTNVRFES
jgi:mannose-6-phosphate isomerase